MNILFFYSEVAAYFLACAETLARDFGCEVHVVRWPVNPEAPFSFRRYEGVTFHERQDHDAESLYALYQDLKPSLVYVSGWMDKGYLAVAQRIGREVPVVCGGDNHWRGDLRQRVATWISPWFLHRRFSHFFVPGLFQYEFARRLGFAPDRILTGMYAADTAAFETAGQAAAETKAHAYPHRFLYVGRLVPEKGVPELVEAFAQLGDARQDWELTLVGAGDLGGQLPRLPGLRVQDFVQPDALPGLAQTAGCFILPSRQEPWGVALHEFAAAGLPLITARNCGAATAFLRPGYNGLMHSPQDAGSIAQAMRQLIALPDATLRRWGERSRDLSRQLNPHTWAATLMQVVEGAAAS